VIDFVDDEGVGEKLRAPLATVCVTCAGDGSLATDLIAEEGFNRGSCQDGRLVDADHGVGVCGVGVGVEGVVGRCCLEASTSASEVIASIGLLVVRPPLCCVRVLGAASVAAGVESTV